MGWGLCRKYFRFWELSMKNSNKQKLKNVLSPLQHDPIADGCGNIAPHHHYSSSTHMDSQTLPTHSVFSFSPSLDYLRYGTLLQSLHPIYLQKPSAHMHPSPPYCRTLTLPHTLCQHLYAIYIIATTDMFFCSYSPYPCNSNPMSTVYTH